MNLSWTPEGWQDYLSWENDRAIRRKINTLIKETLRTPLEGSGKPEALRGNLSGWWSRRITKEHRLVYKVTNDQLIIASCRYHYR